MGPEERLIRAYLSIKLFKGFNSVFTVNEQLLVLCWSYVREGWSYFMADFPNQVKLDSFIACYKDKCILEVE